jgi:hypothetical protein
MVRGGIKDRGHARCAGPWPRPALDVASCAAPTMALAYAARRLQFSASSDGLLLWLSEECWSRGLSHLQIPELEALLPS